MTDKITSIRKEPSHTDLILAINNLENRVENIEKRLDDGTESFSKMAQDISGLSTSVIKLESAIETTNQFLAKLTNWKMLAGLVVLVILAGTGLTLSAIIGLNIADNLSGLKAVVGG